MRIGFVFLPPWATWAPSYAVGLLVSILKQKGHDVKVYDFNIKFHNQVQSEDKNYWHDDNAGNWEKDEFVNNLICKYSSVIQYFITEIAYSEEQVICFSVHSASRRLAKYISKKIKQLAPEKTIVFGGPDCFSSEHSVGYFHDSGVDYLCSGEGELCLPHLLESLDTLKRPDYCQGFLIKNRVTGDIIDCGGAPLIQNLDDLPYPDYSWAIFEDYSIPNRLTTMTSRGCINRCAFCSEGVNFRSYRYRTAENVIGEIYNNMQYFPEDKSVFYTFNDSLINGNMDQFEKLVDAIIEQKLPVFWGGMALVREGMSEELFKKMRLSGCREIMWGIESGSNNVLKKMNKRFTAENAEQVIKDCNSVGIDQYTNLIIGFPGETEADFITTCLFILRNGQYFRLVGLPYMTIRKNSLVYNRAENFQINDPENALEWETTDGLNTFEIRSLRRELLKTILDSKVFHQGRY